ncbi:MAG TPA: squalene/phytoene synthase family protein, partial [Steroidobacteraceae bacterium]|nr:squalene/phytoene synthase family protein [Steroidobacteraceae bacterium]
MPAKAELAPIRRLAVLYCPGRQRTVLADLLAIEGEIRAGIDHGLDHQVAHTRLGWWREECERVSEGRPLHPLTRSLRAHLPPAVRLDGLVALVDLAAWDLARATFDTRLELAGYCARWSGAIFGTLAAAAQPGADPAPVLAVGRALRELEFLNSLAREARAGLLRLPLEELAAAGVAPEALQQPAWAAGLKDLARAQHERVRGELALAWAAVPGTRQPPLRGPCVWSALTYR